MCGRSVRRHLESKTCTMKYPFSELMDRLTIEIRKAHYGKQNASLLFEYRKAVTEKLGVRVADFLWNTIILAEANCDIANLEYAIRSNKELSNEEVGRRALAIREINNLRCMAKATLGQYVGERTDSRRYDQKQRFTSILQPVEPALLVDGEVMRITKYDVPKGRITVVRGRKRAKTSRSRKG